MIVTTLMIPFIKRHHLLKKSVQCLWLNIWKTRTRFASRATNHTTLYLKLWLQSSHLFFELILVTMKNQFSVIMHARQYDTVSIIELQMSNGFFFVYLIFIRVWALSVLCCNELSWRLCKRRLRTPGAAGLQQRVCSDAKLSAVATMTKHCMFISYHTVIKFG